MQEYRELKRLALRNALAELAKLQEQDIIDMTDLDRIIGKIVKIKTEIESIDKG